MSTDSVDNPVNSLLINKNMPDLMNKFNARQKKVIESAWDRGFRDNQIADFLGVPYLDVFHYRKSLGIPVSTISENRYTTWIRLIEQGVSLESIGEAYDINPYSIKIMLWRKKKFSFRESNKAILEEAKLIKAHSQEAILRNKDPFNW